jgi:hypothetical protein
MVRVFAFYTGYPKKCKFVIFMFARKLHFKSNDAFYLELYGPGVPAFFSGPGMTFAGPGSEVGTGTPVPNHT